MTYRVVDEDNQPVLIITDGVSTVALECGLSGLSFNVVVAAQGLGDAVADFAASIRACFLTREADRLAAIDAIAAASRGGVAAAAIRVGSRGETNETSDVVIGCIRQLHPAPTPNGLSSPHRARSPTACSSSAKAICAERCTDTDDAAPGLEASTPLGGLINENEPAA